MKFGGSKGGAQRVGEDEWGGEQAGNIDPIQLSYSLH